MKKRIFAFILAVALMATSVFPAMALDANSLPSDRATLSGLSTDEQLYFLQAQGIEVPHSYSEYITSLITHVEENPNHPIAISNPVTYEIAMKVKNAVNNYYQRDNNQISRAVATYTLQDSTVYGSWSESFLNYNCYAYSVGRTDDFYWPGKFSNVPNKYDFDISDSIYSLACDVKADLKSTSFSNQCVSITTTRPTSLSSGQSCICIRKGPVDFHFMKLSSSSWYHKPGNTNPLKYKYAPSTSRTWTNEASFRGDTYAPDTYYDSTINYLIYSKNHGSTTYTWTGNDYHSGSRHYYEYGYKCDNCGIFTSTTWTSMPCSGPPCATPWSLTPVPEVS